MSDETTGVSGHVGDEIERLAEEFEECTVTKFGHAEHLTIALWHLSRLPEAEARERVSAGLRRLSALDNDGRYNETLTLFWLRAVTAFLRDTDSDLPLPVLRARLAARYADPRLVFNYYSPQLLNSQEAKTAWVEPDLRRLDF
ncbi:MAG TPA: hypothetical protein VK421_21380 [Pyrinomonadaceae bacterium]|nr:hypothetical protein [Pyrinomonadaceae bacterium]